ncbi:hypothetical protein [uncultured Rothia sp.]|uniref:hypothetical protein n=1 Tax=uncultured Rothia sp. TaxID=316088 RepID=UPI0032171513
MNDTRIKVTLNKKGIRQYLNSDSVKDELTRRANRIKQKAGEGYEINLHKTDRARITISTRTQKARETESKNGNLRRALGGE